VEQKEEMGALTQGIKRCHITAGGNEQADSAQDLEGHGALQPHLQPPEGDAISHAPSLAGASFLSGSLVITRDFRKRLKIDRQKVGVRCVVRLAGDAQPSLLLFSILIQGLTPCSSLKPCSLSLSLA
jgi:hypothetical protein